MHLSPKISARRDATLPELFDLTRRAQGSMTGLEPSDPTYGFPFKPYKQQQDLMAHLYRAIAAGQVTVIESPTGTVSCQPTGPGSYADS